MESTENTLSLQGYRKIRFRISRTNHLLVSGSINGVKGEFILDTGASNTCVGFDHVLHFGMETSHSATKAAGAGAVGMMTHESKGNTIRLGRWILKDAPIVVFDLTHVNQALDQYQVKPIQGIIGADILMGADAILDYGKKILYLK